MESKRLENRAAQRRYSSQPSVAAIFAASRDVELMTEAAASSSWVRAIIPMNLSLNICNYDPSINVTTIPSMNAFTIPNNAALENQGDKSFLRLGSQ